MGIGVELDAWVSLCQSLDRHNKVLEQLMQKPIYKPIGGSLNIPSGFTSPVMIRLQGSPSRGRIWNILKVAIFGADPHTAPTNFPTVSQPAVPASTVAVQNPNPFTVQVVISAGTITAVVVNGITVGTAAGTYFVPAFGAISITYSVAPTWVWSAAQATSNVSVDVYAGYVPPVAISATAVPGGFQEVIMSGAGVPTVQQFPRLVEWCRSGEEVFALFYGSGLTAGQNYEVVARVGEYPEQVVESPVA